MAALASAYERPEWKAYESSPEFQAYLQQRARGRLRTRSTSTQPRRLPHWRGRSSSQPNTR